jgi:hypothetical protein
MNKNTIEGSPENKNYNKVSNNSNLDSSLTKRSDIFKDILLNQVLSDDPMQYLNIAKTAIVKQEVDRQVFLSGCEPPIRYIVEIETYLGEKKRIFSFREVHNFWHKNCVRCVIKIYLRGAARQFNLEIDNELDYPSDEEELNEVLNTHKNQECNIDSKKNYSDVANNSKTKDKKNNIDLIETEIRDIIGYMIKAGQCFSCYSDRYYFR